MAASNVYGFLDSSNSDPNDNVGEWQQHVLHRNAKGFNGTGATLFGLMSRLKSEEAASQVYNWWEKDPYPLNFYSDANYSNSATTLTFTNSTLTETVPVWPLFLANMVLENQRTLERVRILADPTSVSVSVARGVQGTNGTPTAAAAIVAGDMWALVTNARSNGSVPPRSSYRQPVNYNNYIQTFAMTASIDNAYKAGVLRTEMDGPKAEAIADALESIANQIEYAYFFGAAEIATLSGGATYYTGGIENGINVAGLTNNVLNGNGSAGVTLDAFKGWLQHPMQVGSDTKIAFAGPNAYAALSNYANSAAGGFRIMNQETIFGMAIDTLVTPFGQLSLTMHPLFKNDISKNGFMAVVDLKLIWQKIMEPLFFQEYEPVNGQDAWQGQFRAKLGIKQKYPEAFGYATNLQLITAS